MNKALSDSDIAPFVKTILMYSQLKTLTPQKLLSLLPAAILYQRTPTYGHWTLLLKTPEGIEFMDPYGMKPDTEFKQLELQQPHYLAKLLLQLHSIIPIHYSPYHFQTPSPTINTCGRWVQWRAYYPHWTIDQFAHKVFKMAKRKHLTPDQLVTLATGN